MGFGKNNTGAILRSKEAVVLLTLAADTAILFGSGITIGEDFRILKSETVAFVEGLTSGDGDGLMLGMANGDLSVTEIAECLLVDGPTDRNDAVKNERAMRAVWIIGGINDLQHNFRGKESGGNIIVHKPRWTFSDPEGWNYFIFNAGLALTTGSTAKLISTIFGVWVT